MYGTIKHKLKHWHVKGVIYMQHYLVCVADGNTLLERVIFTYRDEACYFAEIRRKQGYVVTITETN